MEEYEDPKLRHHVRSLLLDYSLQHLATDYIEYTEGLFDQVFNSLYEAFTSPIRF